MSAAVVTEAESVWLDRLPSEWETIPLKYVVRINERALGESTDPDRTIRYIDIGSVTGTGEITNVQEMRFEEAPSRARRVVCLGDTLVSTVRTYLRAIAFCAESDDALIASTGFAVLTPGSLVEPRFLYYWMRSTPMVDEIVSRSVGVSYPATNASEVGSLPFPRVGRREQKAIAEYLDRKAAAIDNLLAQKKRQLDLLAATRRAVISHAVTHGLDTDTPTRETGHPWLGAIPEHWDLTRLKFHLDGIEQGWSPQCENRPAGDGEWGVLKVGCVNGRKFDPSENKALPLDLDPEPDLEVHVGDVLMSRANTRELLGSSVVIEETRPRLILCDKLYRLRVATTLYKRFLDYALDTPPLRYQIESQATGTSGSMQNISQGIVKNLILPFPPYPEQLAIVGFLDNETERIDFAERKVTSQISKLRQYRQSFITAAVTGQLDIPTS